MTRRGKNIVSCEDSKEGRGNMIVYLSGGFRSGWQDYLIDSLPEIRFIDPRNHSLQDEYEYSFCDLVSIDQCDVVLAYIEKGDWEPCGLLVEVGYAAGRNKKIILVDERNANHHGMVRGCADLKVDSLKKAARILAAIMPTMEGASDEIHA
jgi:hypothetical protein